MASLTDFGDMIIQTQCLVELLSLLGCLYVLYCCNLLTGLGIDNPLLHETLDYYCQNVYPALSQSDF